MKVIRLKNEKGVALITAYIVVSSLITLAIGFSLSAVNELAHARRYRSSAKAFWLAEGAIHQFLQDTTMLDNGQAGVTCTNLEGCIKTISINEKDVKLAKNDGWMRTVTATSNIDGIQRSIQIDFQPLPPDVFDNTMASGGNIELDGNYGIMDVHGKSRITGIYVDSGKNLTATFDDLVENVADTCQTSLSYPDIDENGTPDEFNDFVEFYRDVMAGYSEDEVVYIQGNGTYTITPSADLVGKKIIFIEGDSPGAGDVNIIFDATWEDNQDMTIIATGSINYIQPLESPANNSRLNVVAWTDYYEPAALLAVHDGLTYTHGYANLRDVWDLSVTHGTIIANDHIDVKETMAWKIFNYDSSIKENIPPGFIGLLCGDGSRGITRYQTNPDSWKEI